MKRPISSITTDYILSRLDSRSVVQVKRGLQELCALYRRGYRIYDRNQLNALRIKLSAHVLSSDPKICRWALNAVALAGDKTSNMAAVGHAISNSFESPDIVGPPLPPQLQ